MNSFKCCWTTYCFAPCSTLSFELSRAEGAGQSSPLQSKEKLLSRLSPSHRLRYGRCLFPSVVFSLPLTATRLSGKISSCPWFYAVNPLSRAPPEQFSFFIWCFTDNLSHWRQKRWTNGNRFRRAFYLPTGEATRTKF